MPKAKKQTSKNVILKTAEDKKNDITDAQIFLSSPYMASSLIKSLVDKDGDTLNQEDIFTELFKKNRQVFNGDTEELEQILLNQVSLLDTVFYHYLSRTAKSKYLEHAQTFSDIAFKAQKQCRTTIATLTELKKPRSATFIRQQNNATNQQINNASLKKQPIKSNKIINLKNEQLEIDHDTVDSGAPTASIASHSPMEAVGKIERC
jgi:hypothetical protein